MNPQLLLLDLALIVVLARLFGSAAKRFGQPAVVGEIVAGIALGPSLLNPDVRSVLFPAALKPSLTALADIGLVLFMFVVGYEIDKALIKGREKVAASVSVGLILVPLALGSGLGGWLAARHHVVNPAATALFVGAAMSVTAFPVLARILADRGLHRTRVGGLALASAAVDDVLAWTLLAVVVAIAGAGSSGQWHLLLAPVYLAALAFVVRPALRRMTTVTPNALAAVLVGLLASCAATEWMGLHFIFGAFAFGLVMPRRVEFRAEVLQKVEHVGSVLLLPVFFVVTGMSVDFRTMHVDDVTELALIVVVAVAGKFSGAYLGARASGVDRRDSAVLATLMNTRGLTEIVIASVGLSIGVLDPALFGLFVVMALVTTAMAGPLLRALGVGAPAVAASISRPSLAVSV